MVESLETLVLALECWRRNPWREFVFWSKMESIEYEWVVIWNKRVLNFMGIAYIKIGKLLNYPLKIRN